MGGSFSMRDASFTTRWVAEGINPADVWQI
jgi:hypothetical protein